MGTCCDPPFGTSDLEPDMYLVRLGDGSITPQAKPYPSDVTDERDDERLPATVAGVAFRGHCLPDGPSRGHVVAQRPSQARARELSGARVCQWPRAARLRESAPCSRWLLPLP